MVTHGAGRRDELPAGIDQGGPAGRGRDQEWRIGEGEDDLRVRPGQDVDRSEDRDLPRDGGRGRGARGYSCGDFRLQPAGVAERAVGLGCQRTAGHHGATSAGTMMRAGSGWRIRTQRPSWNWWSPAPCSGRRLPAP